MVYTDLKDNEHHFIYSEGEKLFPDCILTLPLRKSDVIPFDKNVTCVFYIIDFPKISLKPICIKYFDKIDNEFLNDFSYKYITPSFLLVFNKEISDIDSINDVHVPL